MLSLHRKTPYQYLALVVASTLAYGGALRGKFVFDDSAAIVKNADVTNVSTPLLALFGHDFWGNNLTDATSHKSYRPLTVASFQLENRWLGLRAGNMKAVNFVLHTVVCCLLLAVYRELTAADVAFWAALVFTVHPIHTEAVAGIVGRADLLAAFVYVVTIYIYVRLVGWSAGITLPTVFLLTNISVLFKETGITAMAVCALIDVLKCVRWERPVRSVLANRACILRVSALCGLSLATLALRLWIMNFEGPKFHRMDNPIAASDSLQTRVLSRAYLYWLNFWLLLCPDWLSFDWALGSVPLVESFSDLRVVFIPFLFLLGVLLLFFKSPAAKTDIFLSIGLLIIPFLPASGIVKVGFVIAERVLYIPSIGFCYLIATGANRLLRKSRQATVPLLFLCVIFLLKTRYRSEEWTTEELLFRSALRVCPQNAKVYYNIARLATDNYDRDTAFAFYRRAIELHPEYEAAHMNLGNLYREIKDLDTAERHLRRAIEIHEEFPPAWMNLGIVQAAQKNHDDALASYQRALQLKPFYPNCLYNLGNLYIDMQNTSMALRYWRQTVQQHPRHSKAWANILALYDNKGRTQDILRTSELALKFLPNDTSILFTRANAFGKLAKYEEAEQLYLQIIADRPGHAIYHANLGVLYHRWNRRDRAIEHYRSALRIDPSFKSAKTNLLKLMDTVK